MNKKPQIAIIGSVGVPGRYGGFETLAHHLVLQLRDKYDLTVYCSGKSYAKEERLDKWKGAKLVYIPLEANGWQSIFYDLWCVLHALMKSDLLLVLGVSAGLFFPALRFLSGKKILCNIDGLEWRREKWNKWVRRYLKTSESAAVSASDAIVADNTGIQNHVQDAYAKASYLIAYGGDHAKPVAIKERDIEKYPFLAHPYAFKVCRIEPENNIDMVLEAFSQFERYPLVMAGNWAASEYGSQLKARYEDHPNLYLFDPIYKPRAINVLRSNAHVYVHGHKAGGTNPSLVEAMSLALPIIAFDVSYNRATTEDQALYFNSSETLLDQLQRCTRDRLAELGTLMEQIADRRYTWQVIADKYDQAIRFTLAGVRGQELRPFKANSRGHSSTLGSKAA